MIYSVFRPQQYLVLSILSEIRWLKHFFEKKTSATVPLFLAISLRTCRCCLSFAGGPNIMQSILRPYNSYFVFMSTISVFLNNRKCLHTKRTLYLTNIRIFIVLVNNKAVRRKLLNALISNKTRTKLKSNIVI